MSPPLFWTGYSPIEAYFLVAEKKFYGTPVIVSSLYKMVIQY